MSELIDRGDVLGVISCFFEDSFIEDADWHCAELEREINRLPTAPRWVRCEDKKPKSVINKVIVYCESDERNPYVGFGHYEKFQCVEMWYNLETQEPFSKWNYTVTHWMPLPEPPQEDA